MMRCLASSARGTELLGRSLGLASAYRQLAVSQDSERHSFLSVYSTHQQTSRVVQADWSSLWIKNGSQCIHQVRSFLAMGGGEVLDASCLLLFR